MKKMFLLPVIICSLLISGCKEEFSRYPSIRIPQYTEADYVNLLSNKNPEIVYNAVVILGQQADSMGEKLSDEKTDKTSTEYITALNTYKKVVTLLNSKDDRVVAASLRFLQLFGNKYKMKAELLDPVLQIKSNNPQVLYEQMVTLSGIVNKDICIPDATLRKFLNNPSWIVSGNAYLFVNNLENNQIRQELFNKYKLMTDEKEKLLILAAFEQQLSDSLVDSLLAEVLATKSIKVRNAIYDILGNSQNPKKVLFWLGQNYDKIDAADRQYLFELNIATMEDNFSGELVSLLLKKGFVPDKTFLKILNERLDNYESKADMSEPDKEKFKNLMEIEKALLTNKSLSQQWGALRDKTRALNVQLIQLKNEYQSITGEYVTKIDELFGRYNISDKKKQEYLKGIRDSQDNLKELLLTEDSAANEKE